MANKPEFLKIYKTPEETLNAWSKQLNHILSNLINTGYVKVILTANDIQAVPDIRTINGKQLNADINLNSSDIGAVPETRTINGKQLNANITLTADDLGAGITQNITIPDIDGTNYHHLNITNGIVTAYSKNTTP